MTIEEAELWKGEPLTDNEVALLKFLVKGRINGSTNVLVCSAWGRITAELLDAPIPQSALDQVYGEGVVSGLTLRDFSLVVRTFEPEELPAYALFLLSANYKLSPSPKGRGPITTADDVTQWLGLTAPFGITAETALSNEEI